MHTFTDEELSAYAAKQRDIGMGWMIDVVRKSGLPWSQKIAERMERQRAKLQ